MRDMRGAPEPENAPAGSESEAYRYYLECSRDIFHPPHLWPVSFQPLNAKMIEQNEAYARNFKQAAHAMPPQVRMNKEQIESYWADFNARQASTRK